MHTMRFLFTLASTLGLILATPLAPLAQLLQPALSFGTYYVTPDGSPGSTCSITDPCSLHEALAGAVDGNTIYFWEGTYTDYAALDLIDLGKDVSLYGGWYGHSGFPPYIFPLRDPVNHPSILDGENERRILYIHNLITPIIDGLQFTRGIGDVVAQVDLCDAYHPAGCGGAIFIDQAAPTIRNSVFYQNTGRQTMYPDKEGYGGAIYISDPSGTISINNNTFDENTATAFNDGFGGAIAIDGSAGSGAVVIQNNLFTGNIASQLGGAISAYFYNGPLTVVANRFEGNRANWGGAALSIRYSYSALVTQNWFTGQQGKDGAVLVTDTGFTFSRNTMIDNTSDYGLRIFDSASPAPMFTNNQIIRSGNPAIRISGNGDEAPLLTAYFKHNTIVGTGAGTSKAVAVDARNCASDFCAQAYFDNNILFKFSTAFNGDTAGRVVADYTLFYQVTTKSAGNVTNNHEVLESYAGFVDYLQDNYHLVYNAPARDKGKNAGVTIDIDGDPRPLGGGYDLGADQFAYHILLPIVKVP